MIFNEETFEDIQQKINYILQKAPIVEGRTWDGGGGIELSPLSHTRNPENPLGITE